jgi:hypothetical protein
MNEQTDCLSRREFLGGVGLAVASSAVGTGASAAAAEPLGLTRGYLRDYEYSLQAWRDVPYRRWRDYDSADTIRFFALRMREAGGSNRTRRSLSRKGPTGASSMS